MRLPITVIALALLTGCGPESKIEELVKSRLKDPGSAEFDRIMVSEDGRVACGKVNAKNSFGGYAGEEFFMVVNREVRFWNRDNIDDMRLLPTCCYGQIARADGRLPFDDYTREREQACGELEPAVELVSPKTS